MNSGMKRPAEGIATDGAHSQKNGITRFRAVNLVTGKELFNENIGNRTINGGEFLAVVEAVKHIIRLDFHPRIIYTDSTTAIAWFKAKQTASKKKYASLRKAEIFLKTMSVQVSTIEVRHWDNRLWGEIPADFGEKK